MGAIVGAGLAAGRTPDASMARRAARLPVYRLGRGEARLALFDPRRCSSAWRRAGRSAHRGSAGPARRHRPSTSSPGAAPDHRAAALSMRSRRASRCRSSSRPGASRRRSGATPARGRASRSRRRAPGRRPAGRRRPRRHPEAGIPRQPRRRGASCAPSPARLGVGTPAGPAHRSPLPRAAHRALGRSGRRRAPDLLIAPRLGRLNALQFGQIDRARRDRGARRAARHSLPSALRNVTQRGRSMQC